MVRIERLVRTRWARERRSEQVHLHDAGGLDGDFEAGGGVEAYFPAAGRGHVVLDFADGVRYGAGEGLSADVVVAGSCDA